MPHLTHRRRYGTALAALLAASLACNTFVPPAEPTQLAPTAPAATLAASATPPAAATELPVATTPPESLDPEVVTMCAVLSQADAEAVLGQPVTSPSPGAGVCMYADEATRVQVVSGYARQGAAASGIMAGRTFQLGAFGLPLDQAALDELAALDQAADHKPYLEKLAALSQGQTAFSAQSPAGVGDVAYWAWKEFPGGIHQGFLVAVRGDVIAGVDVVIGAGRDEAAVLAAVSALLNQIFDRLPAQFVLEPAAEPTTPPEVVVEVTPLPVPGGLIAFESDRGGGVAQIWLMNNDGTGQSQLTDNDLAGSFEPAWSPDGTRLAFIGWLTADETSAEVFIIAADGSGQRQLTVGAGKSETPAWSPDGTQIIFNSYRDGNSELYRAPVDGTELVRLTNTPADELQPAYSPDGTSIAYVASFEGALHIYRMQADGQGITQLTTGAGVRSRPAWSPAGDRIAFRQRDDAGSNIFVMAADGANPLNLTNNAALNYSPTWSPDGGHLAFVVVTGDTSDIYRMPADGSGPIRLTISPASDAWPAWQPQPGP